MFVSQSNSGTQPEADEDDTSPQISKLKKMTPYIEHAQVLDIGWHPDCPMLTDSLNVIGEISGWKSLRMLHFGGLDAENLDDSFKKLENVISVHFSHSNLQNMDLAILNSWPRLDLKNETITNDVGKTIFKKWNSKSSTCIHISCFSYQLTVCFCTLMFVAKVGAVFLPSMSYV